MPEIKNDSYVANTALEAALTKVREKLDGNLVIGGGGGGTGEPGSTMTAEQAEAIIDKAFEDFEAEAKVKTDMIADGAVTLEKLSPDVQEAWNSQSQCTLLGTRTNSSTSGYTDVASLDNYAAFILLILADNRVIGSTVIPYDLMILATSNETSHEAAIDTYKARCYVSNKRIYLGGINGVSKLYGIGGEI